MFRTHPHQLAFPNIVSFIIEDDEHLFLRFIALPQLFNPVDQFLVQVGGMLLAGEFPLFELCLKGALAVRPNPWLTMIQPSRR